MPCRLSLPCVRLRTPYAATAHVSSGSNSSVRALLRLATLAPRADTSREHCIRSRFAVADLHYLGMISGGDLVSIHGGRASIERDRFSDLTRGGSIAKCEKRLIALP